MGMSRHERLPLDVRAILGPSFPDLDLSRIVLRRGIPFHVRTFAAVTPVAYTSGRFIHFDAAFLDPWSPDALPLLAHEVTHVQQFQKTRFFRVRYLTEYLRLRRKGLGPVDAYARISFEIEARRIEESVRQQVASFPASRVSG